MHTQYLHNLQIIRLINRQVVIVIGQLQIVLDSRKRSIRVYDSYIFPLSMVVSVQVFNNSKIGAVYMRMVVGMDIQETAE